VTSFVHLVEGDRAADRLACLAALASSSRRPLVIFAEGQEQPYSPLDWLMGLGCFCCLPERHPRLHLLRVVSQRAQARVLIDAGPPAVADRIVAILRALPVRMLVNLVAAQDSMDAGIDTKFLARPARTHAFAPETLPNQ
jgi:hypothetical protein